MTKVKTAKKLAQDFVSAIEQWLEETKGKIGSTENRRGLHQGVLRHCGDSHMVKVYLQCMEQECPPRDVSILVWYQLFRRISEHWVTLVEINETIKMIEHVISKALMEKLSGILIFAADTNKAAFMKEFCAILLAILGRSTEIHQLALFWAWRTAQWESMDAFAVEKHIIQGHVFLGMEWIPLHDIPYFFLNGKLCVAGSFSQNWQSMTMLEHIPHAHEVLTKFAMNMVQEVPLEKHMRDDTVLVPMYWIPLMENIKKNFPVEFSLVHGNPDGSERLLLVLRQ